MKRVITFLLPLLCSFGLKAQCADFTLLSLDCTASGEQVFELSASLPPDWFGQIGTYLIDEQSGDTLQTNAFTVGSGVPIFFTTALPNGIYLLVLDLEGLCQDVITVALPESCDGTGNTSNIAGRTWFDTNQDGVRQATEEAVPATVFLEANGNTIITTVTDAVGAYSFSAIPDLPNYFVRFEPMTDDLIFPTLFQVGTDPAVDNDMGINFSAGPYDVSAGLSLENIDAGFKSCELTVGVVDDLIACNGACEGELTAEITGGIAPYAYAWSNGDTRQTITGLCNGTYSVTVTDASGCSIVTNGDVIEESEIVVVFEATPPGCGGNCDGSVTAIVTGGTGPYTYEWRSAGILVTGQTFMDACEGSYNLTVTDATGCAVSFDYFLGTGESFVVTGAATDASCFGTCDGQIDVTVTGGSGQFDYVWTDGQIGPSVAGLCAGIYSVTVVDLTTGCLQTFTFIVEEQSEIISVVSTNADVCGSDCTGTATITTTGGTPPYIYTWGINPEDNGPTFTDLCAGDYEVTVNDANGCGSVVNFVIIEAGLTAAVSRSGGDCDSNGGPFMAEVVVTGGTDPYTFLWDDGLTGSTFPNPDPLTPQSVTITDQQGCSTELTDIVAGEILSLNIFAPFFLTSCDDLSEVVEETQLSLGGEDEVILPSGDTMAYPEGVPALVEGTYQFITTSPNRTCRQQTTFSIVLVDLPDDIELISRFIDGCGNFGCIEIIGSFSFGQGTTSGSLPSIVVTGPDGYVASPQASTQLVVCDLPGPGTYTAVVTNGCQTQIIDIVIDDFPECGSVFGTLYSTADASCTPGANDVPIPFTVIQLVEQLTGDTYFAITDGDGNFEYPLPAGVYQAIPLVNGQAPSGACADVIFTIDGEVSVPVNVYAPAAIFCPQMDLDLCLFQQRRCFENSMSIYYYNEGNIAAENVVLTVELDSFYTDISADVPFTQVGNVLFFELGTVPFCGYGWIQINFTISCDAELGQTHCVNASISPSGFCDPDPVWNGSLINITEAICDGDSVRFTVANVGTNPLTEPLSYVVVEDGIMMSSQPIVTEILEPLEEFHIVLPADGSVFQLVTSQEPGAPVQNAPSLLVQGCGENPTTGFTNLLPLGNGLPWMVTECRENTGSWDPNDKRGFPLGHTGNMIAAGTRLDYNIRFQNTGTDTAFTVVIRDTIGEALDLKTFRIGAASHPFLVEMDTNRVLTFTFDNILLPDSTTNPTGSQGGVTFTIDHDSSLEPGDLIENQAAIYFDFNEPIITNVSTHMIEMKGLPTSLRPILAQRIPLKVFPNPATDWVTIELPNSAVNNEDVLVVTDAFGRDVLRKRVQDIRTTMRLDNLPNGYYVLTLVDRMELAKGRESLIVLD